MTTWEKVSNLIKKINCELIYNKKYLKAEKKFNAKERFQCSYIPVILSDSVYTLYNLVWISISSRGDTEILKTGGAETKFQMVKKVKIRLETISLRQNNCISIFKYTRFIWTMKACQWNLISFSKFAKVLIRKEKKHLCSSLWEKKTEKSWYCFIRGCFIKFFNMIINHFFVSEAHSQSNFCFLISGWRKKYQKGKGTANS